MRAGSPSARPNRSAAPTVWSVAWPLTKSVRAKSRTRLACSCAVIPASAMSPDRSGRRRLCRHVWLHHLARIDDAVELGLGDEAEFQRGRLQREVVVGGVVGDLRGLVVTDD